MRETRLNWYLAPLKNYATFAGRARRTEFWTFALVNAVINGVLCGLYSATESSLFLILAFVFVLAMIVPGIAVTVRRLHDTGRSGAWYFIAFIPFIGGIWLLILALLEGQQGANAYGPDPRQAMAIA
jgi:uncharacterized membrane protein YhaH (DUF805 family)